MTEGSGLFRALPDLLRWRRREAALLARLDGLHAAVVRLRMRSLCGSGPSTLLAAMPPDRRRRVELAPEVYRLLFHDRVRSPRQICAALDGFCAVEDHLAGRRTLVPGPGGAWSALGDVCVGGTGDDAPGMSPSRPSIGGRRVAPVLGRTVVDGCSPFHATVFAEELATEALPAGGFREAVSRLSFALGMIRATCEPAFAMLETCLTVVAPVRIATRPKHRMSISRPIVPGMAGLGNLDAEEWDPDTVADVLVHEAIHTLFEKVRLGDRVFSDPADPEVRVVSPWTGRPLPIGSFVQAVFVWFGLWHFWRRVGSRSRRAAQLAERARKGFDGGLPLRNLPSASRRCLAANVVAAFRTMTREAGSVQAAPDGPAAP